jgi:hypothetical protein
MADEIKEEKPVVEIPEDLSDPTLPEQQRIENIFGILIRTTTAPTWTPKSFYEGFAIDTTNNRFYWYNFTSNTWKYAQHNITIDSLLPSQTGNSGKFLTTNGSVASWGSDNAVVPIAAGETLSLGEVVCIKVGTGDYTSQGYGWTNGAPYAVRAAANDTTYGENILGMAIATVNYLETGNIALIGGITGLSSLTVGSKYYLSNYTGTSAVSITQTTNDATQDLSSTVTQLFNPTSSRLDKAIAYINRSGGIPNISCSLYRGNTLIETISLTPGAGNSELTFDFTDVRVYKGETLSLKFSASGGGTYTIAYKSGGSPYIGGASGGSIPANSDVYFKVYEYPDFGKIATSAGTRKFKLGQAYSATALALNIQEADSTL